ncbi:MAG: glycosyltransferase family 2 protein [Candidatus Pacebacteria bacterium]|nr:glycosyltransferase family 2 protein [Candidatus Paceibacterota bacterium]
MDTNIEINIPTCLQAGIRIIQMQQITTNKKPVVTVLMPVYNGEKYLKEAINSILNQTFNDFEFLIINDGSTDKSEEIICSYKDLRIKLINNEVNLGIIKSLNKGIDLAKGKYIARMDADDISLPKRLEIQVKFMDKNPRIGIAGSWAKVLENGKTQKYAKIISDPEKIKITLLFRCLLIHPSIIIRKNLLEKNNLRYNLNHEHAEDYGLWNNAVKCFPITNIKNALIQYRIHDSNTSKIQSIKQKKTITQLRTTLLKDNLNITPTEEDLLIHREVYKPEDYKTNDFLKKEELWLSKLIEQNKITNFYKEPIFSETISQRWLQICSVNSNQDWEIWKILWKSPLRRKLNFKDWRNWDTLIRFFLKCLIKKMQK